MLVYPTKYEGYYISRSGVLVSFRKPAPKSLPENRLDFTKPKFLKPSVDKDGYLRYVLSVNKKKYYKHAHRLVAETFLPKKPKGDYVIDHKNRNRQDNRVSNLRWIRREENSDGQRNKKTSACKPCICRGYLYGSIYDACIDNGLRYANYTGYDKENVTRRTILYKSVETIEILI